jgi:hypothetical protein
MLPPRLYNSQTQVTTVEVKDLRQTDYWNWVWGYRCLDGMDKILCPHRAIVTTGRPESQVVLRSRWNVLHVGSFRMPWLRITNPARHHHYCSQRSEVLRVSPQGLLNHLLQMPVIPHVSPGRGGRLTNMENLMGYSESRSFNSLTNQSTISVDKADVWWYCRGP